MNSYKNKIYLKTNMRVKILTTKVQLTFTHVSLSLPDNGRLLA